MLVRPDLTNARLRTGRLAYSLFLSAYCVLVLAMQVYVGFERTRFRVVTAPRAAHGPTLTIPLPDLTPLAGHPAAVVVHLGGVTEPLPVTLAVDGQPFAEVRVDPGPAKRADFATDLPAGPGHQFVATASPEVSWSSSSFPASERSTRRFRRRC